MMLTDLATVLRAGGLRVVEQPGWKTRGHTPPQVDVLGVTCHHTGSGRNLGETLGLLTVQNGRPGLDGPLAHLYLNRAGTFYTVAAGKCYHAGVSLKPAYENEHRIGIEALAAGDGWSQDWPQAQMEAYAHGCALLAKHYGFSIAEVRGHKETCAPAGRKIDPSFDMATFRRSVGIWATKPATTKEDDVQLTDKIKLTEAGAAAMSAPGYTPRKEGEEVSLEYMVLWGGPGVYRLAGKVDALAKELAEIKALLTAKKE